MEGRSEDTIKIIKLAPEQNFLDFKNDLLMTPLLLAIANDQPELVRLLVCAGADTSVLDRHGSTALHLAVAVGDLTAVMALTTPVTQQEIEAAGLSYKSYSKSFPPALVNLHDSNGYTCLHLATIGGHCDIIRHLVTNMQANIDIRELTYGGTCVHLTSISWQGQATLEVLLDLGADPNVPNFAGYVFDAMFGDIEQLEEEEDDEMSDEEYDVGYHSDT